MGIGNGKFMGGGMSDLRNQNHLQHLPESVKLGPPMSVNENDVFISDSDQSVNAKHSLRTEDTGEPMVGLPDDWEPVPEIDADVSEMVDTLKATGMTFAQSISHAGATYGFDRVWPSWNEACESMLSDGWKAYGSPSDIDAFEEYRYEESRMILELLACVAIDNSDLAHTLFRRELEGGRICSEPYDAEDSFALNLKEQKWIKSLPTGLCVSSLVVMGCDSWDGLIPQDAKIDNQLWTDTYPEGIELSEWRVRHPLGERREQIPKADG